MNFAKPLKKYKSVDSVNTLKLPGMCLSGQAGVAYVFFDCLIVNNLKAFSGGTRQHSPKATASSINGKENADTNTVDQSI